MPGTGVEVSGLTPPKTGIREDGGAECGALEDENAPNLPPADVSTLADLLTALPSQDRADIIAGLPQEQRLAVTKLIAGRITEDNTNE